MLKKKNLIYKWGNNLGYSQAKVASGTFFKISYHIIQAKSKFTFLVQFQQNNSVIHWKRYGLVIKKTGSRQSKTA